MMHRAWSSIVEVPYCILRSYIKFQGHTALKIVEFDPNWAFPDCNSSLNSPMAMKCCTKFQTAKERCPIVFQGHPSNFKVTRYKTSPILTQIGLFRTIGRSQLSNPSDLPCSPMICQINGALTFSFIILIVFFLRLIITCISMWGKIIIPMYRLWLNGLYGLYGPRCPLFSKRPINLISLSLLIVLCHEESQCMPLWYIALIYSEYEGINSVWPVD